jgi:hypothetical protein
MNWYQFTVLVILLLNVLEALSRIETAIKKGKEKP